VTDTHPDASNSLDQFIGDLSLTYMDFTRAGDQLETIHLPVDFSAMVRTIRAVAGAVAAIVAEASDAAEIVASDVPLSIDENGESRWPLSSRELVGSQAITNPGASLTTFAALLAHHGASPDDYPDWPLPAPQGLMGAGDLMIEAKDEFDQERAKRRHGSTVDVDVFRWLQALSDAHCPTCSATPAVPCTTAKYEPLPLHRSHRARRRAAALYVGWTRSQVPN
jgi:hypothetical protein